MATGVIPCEPWKRALSQVGDLNNCLYQGEYLYGATTSNIPEANSYGLCYVHSSNMPDSAGTGWTIQMAYSTSGKIYTRRKINSGGSWTSWIRIDSKYQWLDKGYSNVVVPASGYVKLESIYDAGVPNSAVPVSITIQGWVGASNNSVMNVCLGSNGTDMYLMCNIAQTIGTVGVRILYYYINT